MSVWGGNDTVAARGLVAALVREVSVAASAALLRACVGVLRRLLEHLGQGANGKSSGKSPMAAGISELLLRHLVLMC